MLARVGRKFECCLNRTRLEARRDQILERVGQSGQALSYVALRALAGDVEAGIEPLDPRKLAPADVVRFMRTRQSWS